MQNSDDKKNVNEFMGFSLFNDVENPKLRAWNRLNVFANITAMSPGMAQNYMGKFNKTDMFQINVMFAHIKRVGYETVQKEIKAAV